jgi:hypothetical protein
MNQIEILGRLLSEPAPEENVCEEPPCEVEEVEHHDDTHSIGPGRKMLASIFVTLLCG